jgi:hypothetical protein
MLATARDGVARERNVKQDPKGTKRGDGAEPSRASDTSKASVKPPLNREKTQKDLDDDERRRADDDGMAGADRDQRRPKRNHAERSSA